MKNSELELRKEERLREILMDFRELNKITCFTCREGQSKRRRGRSESLSLRCRVQSGESFSPSLKAWAGKSE